MYAKTTSQTIMLRKNELQNMENNCKLYTNHTLTLDLTQFYTCATKNYHKSLNSTLYPLHFKLC